MTMPDRRIATTMMADKHGAEGRPDPIAVGLQVGAGRWPYASGSPEGWLPPVRGVTLAADDPRAWANTIAFPTDAPEPQAVAAHVQKMIELGHLDRHGRVPVAWEIGTARKVYWEPAASLRPYAEDLLAWEQARESALGHGQDAKAECLPSPSP